MPSTKERAVGIWTTQRAKRPWLDHAVRSWTQTSETNATLLAGALTFLSFLALFPLILLGVSIMGFVLSSDHDLERRLLDKVAEQAPGGFGDTIHDAIQSAINARAGVGVIALVGVLLTGLGWVNNLRLATEQVWGHRPPKRSFLAAKSADLVVLAGLGLGLLVSVGITAVGSALSGAVLRGIGLSDGVAAHLVTTVVGIVIAIVADLVIFWFLLVRLPKADVPRGIALRGSLLAAIGFEVLKLVGTYYIASVAKSPTAGVFGSIIGVLVWLNLVFRFLLYCTAWTATAVSGGSAVAQGLAPVGTPRATGGDVRASTASSPPTTPRRPGRGPAWALVLGALARKRR